MVALSLNHRLFSATPSGVQNKNTTHAGRDGPRQRRTTGNHTHQCGFECVFAPDQFSVVALSLNHRLFSATPSGVHNKNTTHAGRDTPRQRGTACSHTHPCGFECVFWGTSFRWWRYRLTTGYSLRPHPGYKAKTQHTLGETCRHTHPCGFAFAFARRIPLMLPDYPRASIHSRTVLSPATTDLASLGAVECSVMFNARVSSAMYGCHSATISRTTASSAA